VTQLLPTYRILAGILIFVAASASTDAGLNLLFEDNSAAYDPSDVWITFDNGGGATPFDVTYNGGTAVTIAGGGTPNHLSNPIQLSTVTDQTFSINSVSSVAVFVSYGDPFTVLNASPSFFSGSVSAGISYQNFEITRTGGNGDQGNLTNINYFTAPMSIKSYSASYDSGNTPLQSVGFHQTTAQVASSLASLSPTNSVTEGGTLRRYVGPSTWTTNPPYASFANYLSSVHTSAVTNTIKNSNAFLTNGATSSTGKNYNFTFNMTSSVAADNSIQLTGAITTAVTDNASGITTPGATYNNANITLSGADMSKLNSILYGQTANPADLNTAVTWGQGWDDWAAFVQNPTNDLTDSFPVGDTMEELTLSATAIGEISSAILMGFLGNTTVVEGTALNDMPSEDWWKLDPSQAFDDIQGDSDNYNQWANAIYAASDNGAYSIPYSDRLGKGPLVNSVQYTIEATSYDVDKWVVGFGDPVSEIPEPASMTLLLLGGAALLRRRRQ